MIRPPLSGTQGNSGACATGASWTDRAGMPISEQRERVLDCDATATAGPIQADSSIDAAFAAFVAAEAGSEYPRQVKSKGRRQDERSGSQTAVEVAHHVSQIEHG
jgi:hypothetical protein